MRVLLSGYYGFGNLGDEALLDVIVATLRTRFPYIEIDVLSATPEETARRLRVEATPRADMRRVSAAIDRADVVLSGGGGLLQNATSLRSLIYYTSILRRAVHAKKQTMIFAQSIGPLDRIGRIVVKHACGNVSRATVRDERSAKLLKTLIPEVAVERTADPVFLYEPPDASIDLTREGLGPESQPYVLVSLRKSAGFNDGIATIAAAVDRLANVHNVRVAFLALGGTPDAEAATKVIRRCESAPVLIPETSLERTAEMIRRAHGVIGMRLHALILAARFGVPFLAIPYDPKVAALCDDLAYPLDPLWIPGKPAPEAKLTEALTDRLLSENAALRAHLEERLVAVRASAERNFDVLAELLKNR